MNCQCDQIFNSNNQDFLFDDDNIKRQCLKCRKHHSQSFANGPTSGYLNNYTSGDKSGHTNEILNGHINDGFSSILEDNGDDHTESSEDAPLITDCFKESDKDISFHCHDVCFARNDSKAAKQLVWASAFCFLFVIAELIGGYFAQSLAIMTDAAHLMTDFIGFMISVLSVWLANKPRTKYMTFGYQRAEVLGAFLSVLTIWMLVILFSYLAIIRLYHKDYDVNADTMMIVAGIGLLVNILMGGILHGTCHPHSHGVSFESSDNINVQAAAAHVLGDLLQSVGVLLAALIIKFVPNSQAADPICTLIFSAIMIFTNTKVCKDSVLILMQASPTNRDQILLELKKIPNIRHVHDLQIWSLAPGKNVVTVHIGVEDNCDRDLVIEKTTQSIKSQMSLLSCTVQVESYNSDATNNCLECSLRQ